MEVHGPRYPSNSRLRVDLLLNHRRQIRTFFCRRGGHRRSGSAPRAVTLLARSTDRSLQPLRTLWARKAGEFLLGENLGVADGAGVPEESHDGCCRRPIPKSSTTDTILGEKHP